MDKLQLYCVSDKYVSYLQKSENRVYSNKKGQRRHMRKYVGVVLKLDQYYYYVPMSSPKESDYIIENGEKKIRKSNLTIIRIVVTNSMGIDELKGTLRISNMIPVPEQELVLYDVYNECDEAYKDLILKELIFIRKQKQSIIKNAKIVYKQKKLGHITSGYMQAVLDFDKLEKMHDVYMAED